MSALRWVRGGCESSLPVSSYGESQDAPRDQEGDTLAVPVQRCTGSLSQIIGLGNEMQGLQFRKEEVKLPLLADDVISCKSFTKTLLELINEFGKVAGY